MAEPYPQYQSAPPVGLGLTYPSGAMGALPMIADFGMGFMSMLGQERANRTNIMLAREQMKFQERMSSTAIQRATQDMRMAGINPMLAAHGGASTPGGATAHVDDVLGPAVSSVQHARQLRSELELMRKQMRNVDAEADLKDQNRRESFAREKLTDAERKLRELAIPQAERSAEIYSGKSGWLAGVSDAIFGGRGPLAPLGLRR